MLNMAKIFPKHQRLAILSGSHAFEAHQKVLFSAGFCWGLSQSTIVKVLLDLKERLMKNSQGWLIDHYPLLNPLFLLGKQFRREVGLPWLNDFEWFLNVYYKRFCDNSVSSPTWHVLLPAWHNFCILGCTNQGELLQFIKCHLQGGFSLTQRNKNGLRLEVGKLLSLTQPAILSHPTIW